MISEKLSAVYATLEDKYYNLLDFLDSKGIPVYAYNDFLEEKGIPAFPFTVAIILLLIVGIAAFVSISATLNPTISFNLEDQFHDSIGAVLVTVKDESGGEIKKETVGDGGSIKLQGIRIGTTLDFIGEKEGYEPDEYSLQIKEEINTVNLQLTQVIKNVPAQLTIVDKISRDGIANAHVVGRWRELSIDAYSDSAGIAQLAAVPENVQIRFTIDAEAYEPLTENYSFLTGENKTVELSPKSISLQGISKLLITVKDEQGDLIDDAQIIIRDRTNDNVLFEDTADNGEYYAEIPKGTSIRLTVQKSGYLRYDSLTELESRTLRQDEETWSVILEKGGEILTVLVYAEGQTPLGNAEVQLFDLENNLIDRDTTGFGGSVEFTDLNAEQFYVTAWRDGYLPARRQVNVAETETVALTLQASDATNSVYLAVYVIDSMLAAANNADLFFFEKQGSQLLPLGIPAMKTDISGYASTKVPIDITVEVQAKKGLEEGFAEKEIESGILNEIRIQLQRAVSIVELFVLDESGNPAQGNIRITTLNGDLLFDGDFNGSVLFDAEGNERVNVEVTTADGKTYTEQVNVKDKSEATLKLGEAPAELAPTISFKGIFNSNDEQVDAITKGEYYWVKFEINFPEGTPKGGMHIRAGKDDVAFIDSQEFGIVGFDAIATDYLFGKSYQPSPSPGNESADKQNKGKAGSLNKWLELYFEKPSNTVVAKVKVMAETTLVDEELELHYRGWSVAGGNYYRTPSDAELGTALFSSTKTPLYAETNVEKIKAFNTAATCKQELCTSYRFVNVDGLYIEADQFKPIVGNTYALEIDLRAAKQLTATLQLDTSKTAPLLFFTGQEIDSFNNMPSEQEIAEKLPADTDLTSSGYLEGTTPLPAAGTDSELETNPYGFAQDGSSETSLTISSINMLENQQRTVRVYFKTTASGQTFINTQAIAGSVVINKDFRFSINKAKELLLSVPTEIQVGKDFTVNVKDKETNAAIGNATLHLKDSKGNIAASIVGNNTIGKGSNGNYLFKNSFSPGLYKIEAIAKDYAAAELAITIAQDNLLYMKGELKIRIEKEQRQGSVSTSLKNLSEQSIQRITYELVKPDNFPEEFIVSVDVPPSLNERQEGRITVNVEVDLEQGSEKSLHGELELMVKGLIAGEVPTKTKSKVIIDFNKKLDSDCLKFDKEQLRLKLIGMPGSSATEEIELENKCEEELSLRAEVEAKVEDPNLTVSASPVTIKAGETVKARVSAVNTIERMYALQRPFEYILTFESSKLSKSIAVFVELWNPRFNLAFPPNIPLWLVRAPTENIAKGTKSLYVRNTGQVPITAFRMAIEDEPYKAYPQLRVTMQPYSVDRATIYAGQPLVPTRYVQAEFVGETAFTKPVTGSVSFHGVVMGREYEFGKTAVPVNYGGYNCLKLAGNESMDFSSRATYGIQQKSITLTNECLEPVRVRTIEPREVQGNMLYLVPSDITIQPRATQKAMLQLAIAKEAGHRTLKIKAVGLLVLSQQFVESNPVEISIEIGERAKPGEGKATTEKEVKVCGSEEKRKIAFPKLSSDCSQGYCDAKQLAQYLAKELNNLMKRVKQKIYRAEHDARNFPGCANNDYCAFSSMGVELPQLVVFMQLDNMTTEVLENEISRGGYDELRIFPNVSQSEKRFENIGGTGFSYGEIHLGGLYKGCGKYYITIDGAVQVINNEIIVEGQSFVVMVNQNDERTLTPECENAIQNVPNFLPLDEGFTKDEYYGSLLGLVWREYGQPKDKEKIDKAAERFAETLFKVKEPRIVDERRETNLIKPVLGGAEDALIKIEIEGSSDSDEPKLIIARLPSGEEVKIEEIAKEAAEAVSALKSGITKGCIDPNDPPLYLMITESTLAEKLLGKLSINTLYKTIKINTQEQCIDFNVTSKKKDEPIVLHTNFLTDYAKRTGIEKVSIKTKDGKELLTELANGTRTKEPQEAELSSESKQDKLYYADFKLCITGDSLFGLASENISNIKVFAESRLKPGEGIPEIGDRKTDPPLEVKIDACGIHPIELVKKMAEVKPDDLKKGPQEYYALVAWNGPKDAKVKIAALQKYLAVELAKEKAGEQFVAGTGAPASASAEWKRDTSDKMLMGTLAFFGFCSIVPIAEGILAALGVANLAKNAIYDEIYVCGLPSIIATRNATRVRGEAWAAANEVIDTITKVLAPLIMVTSLIGGPRGLMQTAPVATPLLIDAFAHDVEHLSPDELAARAESFADTITTGNPGFWGGWIGKMLNLADDAGKIISADNAKYFAQKYRKMITLDVKKIEPNLAKEILDEMEKQFEKTLRTKIGKPMSQEILTEMGTVASASIPEKIAKKLTEMTPAELTAALSDEELRKLLSKDTTKTVNQRLDEILPLAGDNTPFSVTAIQRAEALKPAPPPSLPSPSQINLVHEAWRQQTERMSEQYRDELQAWQTQFIAASKKERKLLSTQKPTPPKLPTEPEMLNPEYKIWEQRTQQINQQYADDMTKWRNQVNNLTDDVIPDQIADDIIGDLAQKTGKNTDEIAAALGGKDRVIEKIRQTGSSRGAYRTIRNSPEIRNITLTGNEQQVAQGMFKKAVAESDDLHKLTDPTAYGKLKSTQKIGLRDKLKNIGSFVKANWKSLTVNLLTGIATGIVADYVGSLGHKMYWKNVKPLTEGQTGITGAKSTAGVAEKDLLSRPIINIDELRNGLYYKITASIDGYGRISFLFYEVPESGMGEMRAFLQKYPEKEWKGDCKKYAKEPAPEVIGSLVPEEKDNISANMRAHYYNNAETIYRIAHTYWRTEPERMEAYIMAVLSVDVKEIPECNMQPTWYMESKERRDSMLECVAKQIANRGLLGGDGKPGIFGGAPTAKRFALNESLKKQIGLWEKTIWARKVGS